MALPQKTELTRERTIPRPVAAEPSPADGFQSDRESRQQAIDTIFKALADSTRREILLLLTRRPLAVNEIVDHFDLTQPSISRHLAILLGAGLVARERHGQRVIYRLGETKRLGPAAGFLTSVAAPRDRANV